MPTWSKKTVVLTGAAAVMLVGAGAMLWNSSGAGEGRPDFPDGHPYICADCGHVTVLSNDELLDLRVKARESDDPDAVRVVCSDCNSANVNPAVRCPACGEYFPPPEGRPVCPHCQQPFPSPFDDG